REKMTSPSPTHSDSSGSSKHDSNQDSWEIVEGLRGVPASMQEPVRQEGFLLKRRKWPMKGWHKLKKGKLHGRIDVGLSVMAIKKKAMCIDLDNEDNIYHLKVTHMSQDYLNEECQSYLLELNLLLKSMEVLHRTYSAPAISALQVKSTHITLAIVSNVDTFFVLIDAICISSVVTLTRRRSTLPSPCPASSVSLWNILRNNIGKDLSKVAMPVHLNEPLNTLQRLCEELEYSELLDIANQTQDPYQRMVYVATFAISAYASTYHRAGSKPFNPVLGETYECDRPDKGFRFIAEQVSHHPPVSACHSDSRNFSFWQDVRWKNKFWGKSMEIVPMGTTHVTLPAFGDHYEWNKVTSCIHNILSGQRWIEHYGEMSIKNINSDACQCKVTFVKAKSWSSTVNEIEAVITDSNGKIVHSIFGKWHESVFQGNPPSATCIWRANSMPVDQDQYYGFTQFAVELNELDSTQRPLLPPTDTRLRPDQRLLEEGNPDAAEEQKQRIEQLQRERRKVLQDNSMTHQPRFFKKSKDDTWVSNNAYWEQRRDPGFGKVDFPVLW
uniref:Oxysterol-binding protein n=1 Tax=Scophthalmus maximus TaxID=52904 RepID=A0A8D3DXW1_SCOMX